MKQLIVDSEGIKLAEMPEFPNQKYTVTVQEYEAIEAEYERQKTKAIAEAKLFEDQERAKEYLPEEALEFTTDLLGSSYKPIHGTYPLPADLPKYVEVRKVKMISGEWMDVEEVNFQNVDYEPEFRTILRFVDKQEQRKEETQEELWRMIENQCVYNDGYFDIEKAKELATIKRK